MVMFHWPWYFFILQRFEHKTNDKSSARKIDTAVRFPASLNMAPFTTPAMKETEKESSGSSFP